MPSPRKPLPAATIKEAVQLFATGQATRRKVKALGIPEPRYPALKRAAEEELTAFKDEMGAVLRSTLLDIGKRLERESGQLSVSQLAVTLGILADKHKQLHETGPHSLSQTLNLHIKGDTGSALRAILGPAADKVFSGHTSAHPSPTEPGQS